MWNGQFAKHRDHRHGSFVEHEKANGGRLRIGRMVPVVVNPITLEALEDKTDYYEVTFTLHDGSEYVFLVRSDTPGKPSDDEIESQIEQQLKNRVEGGRRVEDFIADIEVEGTNQRNDLPEFSLSTILTGVDAPQNGRTGRFSIDDLL